MSKFRPSRRTVLRLTALAGASAALATVPMAQAAPQFSTIPRPNEVLSADTVMHVGYCTSLREPGDSFEIHLGALSPPFPTRDGRSFRIQIIPGPPLTDPRLGPSFTLILADEEGKELARSNSGNSVTTTFMDQGIQFYIARL